MKDSKVTTKSEENRVRDKAKRRGYKLSKSARRDPLSIDYGRWRVCDPESGALIAEFENVEAAEAWLDKGGHRGSRNQAEPIDDISDDNAER